MLVPHGHPKMTIPRRQHSTKKMILDIQKILTSLEFSIGTELLQIQKQTFSITDDFVTILLILAVQAVQL